MAEKINDSHFSSGAGNARDVLKGLSSADFLNFGIQDIAYVRFVEAEGQTGFAIHAADGTPLSVVDSEAEAYMLAKQNDLETAAVH